MADAMDTTDTKVSEVDAEAGKKRNASESIDDEAKRIKTDGDAAGNGDAEAGDKEPAMSDSEFLEELKTLCGPEGEEAAGEEEAGEQDTSVQDMDADEFLEATSKFLKQEKDSQLGPEIDPKIAALVNKMMRVKLDVEKVKALTKKCRRPANAENLTITKINSKVWSQLLDGNAKCDDLRMQGMQRTLVQGMSPMVYMLDTLFKVKKGEIQPEDVDMSEMLAQCTDSMTMLSQCYYRINQKRRHLLLPYFEESYRKQVAREAVPSEYLFSESIEKAITDGKLKRIQNPQRSRDGGNRSGGFRPRGGLPMGGRGGQRGGRGAGNQRPQHNRSFSGGSGGGYNQNRGYNQGYGGGYNDNYQDRSYGGGWKQPSSFRGRGRPY